MKLKNSIRTLCLACFAAVLMFSSCEKEKEYTSMSYINKEAVFNDTVNPVEKIPWINGLYNDMVNIYAQRTDYQALISYIAKEDSTQSIFMFTGNYAELYRYDGKRHYVEVTFEDRIEIYECPLSALSIKTKNMLYEMINEALNNNSTTQCNRNSIITKDAPPSIEPYVDEILYTASNVEILYCSKRIEL